VPRRTVVIDAGKNFQAAALEWFPKYGLRRIDALLITHPHADGTLLSILYDVGISNIALSAMNGPYRALGWTLNNAIQSHIDVYVSQDTLVEVQRSFPYLVAKEFASGGGDVIESNIFHGSDELMLPAGTGIQMAHHK